MAPSIKCLPLAHFRISGCWDPTCVRLPAQRGVSLSFVPPARRSAQGVPAASESPGPGSREPQLPARLRVLLQAWQDWGTRFRARVLTSSLRPCAAGTDQPSPLAAPDLGVRPRSTSRQCAFTCYPSPKVSVSKASGESAGWRKLGAWPRK